VERWAVVPMETHRLRVRWNLLVPQHQFPRHLVTFVSYLQQWNPNAERASSISSIWTNNLKGPTSGKARYLSLALFLSLNNDLHSYTGILRIIHENT